MVGGVYGGRDWFFLLFGVITTGCLWELSSLLLDPGERYFQARRILGCLAGLWPVLWWCTDILYHGSCASCTPDAFRQNHWEAQIRLGAFILGGEALFISLFLLFELVGAAQKPFNNLGHLLTGLFYIAMPVLFLVSIATPAGAYQPNRVFGLLWLVWTNDTLAYLIGSQIGKTKLFERISPKKTWEGTLGGVIGTILMAWGLAHGVPDFNLGQWLALGAVVSVFGTLGDLVESMLKRSVGVKDSGNLFPGHGGFLDRFDAFLFMLPIAWLAVTLLGG